MKKVVLIWVAVLALTAAAGASAYGLAKWHTVYLKHGHCVKIYKAHVRVCAKAKKKVTPPTTGKAQDKGIVVQDLQIKDDGLGDIGGFARLTNTLGHSVTITFTFTFFGSSGKAVATAEGSANDIGAGQTVTAQLLSQDSISSVPSSFKYQFQVDAEF